VTEPRPRGLWVLRGLVAVLFAAGVGRAVGMGGGRSGSSEDPTSQTALPAVGQNIPTSFGVLRIKTMVALSDQSASAFGALPGGGPAAPPGRLWVQVAAALANAGDSGVSYQPGQFHLRLGQSGPALSPTRASPDGGTLPPQSSADALLGFVVPKVHPGLWLEFDDRNGARPVLIDLGRVAVLGHHGSGSSAHAHE
jgi:hypothetical protein